MSHSIARAYDAARDQYADHGVDVDQALRTLATIPISN